MIIASDILKNALKRRGTLQRELATKMDKPYKTFNRKICENRMTAQELITSLELLGYEILLADIETGDSTEIRNQGIGRRVKKMMDGILYDTQKADALCHTPTENGWFMEVYKDDEGRFFVVHYSNWEGADDFLSTCPEDVAKHLIEAYT